MITCYLYGTLKRIGKSSIFQQKKHGTICMDQDLKLDLFSTVIHMSILIRDLLTISLNINSLVQDFMTKNEAIE